MTTKPKAEAALLADDRGAFRLLTLNRPRQLNALDAGLRGEVVAALGRAGADPKVRVVVLTGAGERGFCAGQDLDESAGWDAEGGGGWQASWKDFTDAFLAFPKPIVVAVNGVAAGGGFITVLLADIRLAVPTATFPMAEVNIGLPSLFGSYLLAEDIFWSAALEIVLSGRAVPADEAKRLGFIHEIAAPAALMPRAIERAEELALKAPTAMRLNIARLREIRRRRIAENRVVEAFESYQREALATGVPQKVMAEFLKARAARRATRQGERKS